MIAQGVLAVMDAVIKVMRKNAQTELMSGDPVIAAAMIAKLAAQDEARATVAELIEADKEVDEAEALLLRIHMAGPRHGSYGTGWETRDAAHRCDLERRLQAAHERRAKALARAGGDA